MRDFVTVVSGMPRSGTSMMMNMLASGGLRVAVDNERTADEDNPKGYFELERVKEIARDASWIDATRGGAVKMVSMLLSKLPADREYRIVSRHDLAYAEAPTMNKGKFKGALRITSPQQFWSASKYLIIVEN